MSDLGSKMAGVPGGGGAEGGPKSRDMKLEGKELKVLSQAYLKELMGRKQELPELRQTLERDFPGYTLPSEVDLATLKLNGGDRRENLDKIMGEEKVPGDKFNLFSCDGDKFNRVQFLNDSSYTEQQISSNDRDWPHLRDEDFLFLIKKTNS